MTKRVKFNINLGSKVVTSVRYGDIYIPELTSYISCGTTITYGAKTIFISEFLPDRNSDEVVLKCRHLKCDGEYYEALLAIIDDKKHKFKSVAKW